jgi:hypothetical protein
MEASTSMIRDSYANHAVDHIRKLSIDRFVPLFLKIKLPVLSSMDDSIVELGSVHGTKSARFTYSQDLAAAQVFLLILAPENNGMG